MCSRSDFPPYDGTPECDDCGAPATHRVTQIGKPHVSRLVCNMALGPYVEFSDDWTVYRLRRADLGLPPLPRRKAVHV